MKTYNKIANILISSAVVTLLLSGCSTETPFETSGDGVLRMNTEYRSDIKITTRAAVGGYTEEELNEKLVIYVEKKNKGLVRKFIGKDQIPESFTLAKGDYVVEGWTGDSTSASFSDKFFRGYKEITIGEGVNDLSFKLNIANVVVAVDKKDLNQEIKDLSIKVYHSRGELEFTNTEIETSKRGYFMMPNADKDLKYIIEGSKADGSPFSKTGEIKNVERGHLYNMVLLTEDTPFSQGGALIRLEIQDIDIIKEDFEILPPPVFKTVMAGVEIDPDKQIVSVENQFNDVAVRSLIYTSYEDGEEASKIKNLSLSFSNNFTGMEDIEGKNLLEDQNAKSSLISKGVACEMQTVNELSSEKDKEKVRIIETWFTISGPDFLNILQESNEPYTIAFTAVDDRGYTNSMTLSFANSEDAIIRVDPVGGAPAPDVNVDPMAILAGSAEITGYLYADEDGTDYGIKYRKVDQGEWKTVSAKGTAVASRATTIKSYRVKLVNLEPGTSYEYKAYYGEFEEQISQTFTTESKYLIPNADMEQWCEDDGIKEPSSLASLHSFWDTGNHGSSTLGVTLTQESTDMKTSGNYSAKLRSQFVGLNALLGKFAAGNLFFGKYAGTSGTNGIIDFGQEYDSSHPSGLKVMVNYRPGEVASNYSGQSYQKKGDMDQGQIYVALTTEKIRVSTADKSTLFDEARKTDKVIAYGELTFAGNYGEENILKEAIINLKYKDIAKSITPKYLVIVCSASKYGDYFTGGEGSTMYLDDFELEYGDIQFE